jgi:hypothetical protein
MIINYYKMLKIDIIELNIVGIVETEHAKIVSDGDTVDDPLADPMADPMADPVANPIADTIADPVANPIADPMADPIEDADEEPDEDADKDEDTDATENTVNIKQSNINKQLNSLIMSAAKFFRQQKKN